MNCGQTSQNHARINWNKHTTWEIWTACSLCEYLWVANVDVLNGVPVNQREWSSLVQEQQREGATTTVPETPLKPERRMTLVPQNWRQSRPINLQAHSIQQQRNCNNDGRSHWRSPKFQGNKTAQKTQIQSEETNSGNEECEEGAHFLSRSKRWFRQQTPLRRCDTVVKF